MTTDLWRTRLDRIIDDVQRLGADEIRRRAAELRDEDARPGHELSWWQQTLVIDRELRRSRRSREATVAARRVVDALEAAALRSGLVADDPDVTCMAEALRTVTRATVVGFTGAFGASSFRVGGSVPKPAALAPTALPELWASRRSA